MERKREYEEGPDPLLFGDFVFPFLFSSQSKPVGAHGAGHLGGITGFGDNRSTHESGSRQAN